ncbi:MAG: hypothetical protein IKL96_08125 [Kiritimatiellae bacterium]|nr:hypothetical protein [Kiritimatiellia bacterium]
MTEEEKTTATLPSDVTGFLGMGQERTGGYDTLVRQPSFAGGTDEFTDQTKKERRARFKASADMLFSTDVSKLDDAGASALYQSVTEGLFGLPDEDGSVAFGKRASKDPRANIDMLRKFVKGDYTLIEDPEYTKWRQMDDEAKFKYALENETTRNSLRSTFKGERGPSVPELLTHALTPAPMKFGALRTEAERETQRKMRYEDLTDEEKAAYRADVIGDYEEKLSRRQTLATFFQFAHGLSDRAGYLLAKSFADGTPDAANIEGLPEDERDRVYAAFSLMRGDQKKGRILGIQTDFTDDTVANRLQLGLYGFQQSVVGLVTDTGEMARDFGTWGLAKAGIDISRLTAADIAMFRYSHAIMDEAERKEFFKGWDANVRAEQAMKQSLPEADGVFGEAFQGLAENLHWFIPYSMIGKGGRMVTAARGFKEGENALKGWKKVFQPLKDLKVTLTPMRLGGDLKGQKAVAETSKAIAEANVAATKAAYMLDINGVKKLGEYGSSIVARQIAAVESFTQRLRSIDADLKAAKWWKDAAGTAMWAAGEASAFSAFASEYVANADAAGISREESVLTAAAIGLINAKIEQLYVPGLESSLTPAQIKSLTFAAMAQAVKTDGAAGFRKWLANRVSKGVTEGVKVTLTEGAVEEPLQQMAAEHGKAFDKLCGELRANGQATLANEAKALWDSFAATLPNDYATFIDTSADMVPSSLGFGVTTVGNMTRRQHIHNAMTRHANRRAGSTSTMMPAQTMQELQGATDYDAGLVDVIQQAVNVRAAVEKHWQGEEDGGEARNPHRFEEAITAARRAWRNPKTGDVVQEVADAAGVDVKTAEVLAQYLQTEAEAAAFSPQARAWTSLNMSLADIDEATIKTVLPGYVEGSFASDPENGIYSGRVRMDDGTEKTIAYRVGDLSAELVAEAQNMAKADSRFGKSFDARHAELGDGVTWASLSDAQRYAEAMRSQTSVNGFSTGKSGVFELTDSKGEKVRVNADDIIYLANGRIGDIGYGPAATQGTVRHETFHSLWRFVRGTLADADVQQLAKTLGIDVTKDGWEVALDERMAHEMERYASGHYVSHAVSSRFDKMLDSWAGKIINFFGQFGPSDEVTDPKTGKPYQLKGLYDSILRGELGSGALGVELRKVPAQPAPDGVRGEAPSVVKSAMPVEVTDADRAAQEAEMRAEAKEEKPSPAPTSPAPTVTPAPTAAPVQAATAEHPADAATPNQRYYKVGLPNSPVKLVGRLEVRDASTDVITSTDAEYHDRGNQNRDDKSEESRALVEKIGANPDPLQIGTVQPIASNGIIWMLPNGDVIIGNHRVNGVRRAYEKGTAGDLEKFVREDAAKRGIEIGADVKKPLMVFVLERIESPDGKADVHEVVRLANESQNRGFNIREQAGNDAKILADNNLLPRMEFRADGRIDETKSGDAIGKFRQESGAQGLIAEDGSLTEEGQTRIQNAALAVLLGGEGNNALLQKIMSNAGRLDMQSELRALMKMTPELMALGVAKPGYDLRAPLAEALQLFTEWRDKDETARVEKGKTRHDWRETKDGRRVRGLSWEAYLSQGDMFRAPSDEAKILGDLFAKAESLRSFDREDVESAAGKKRVIDLISDYLADYIANARAVNTETDDMYGGSPASRADVLAAQRATGGADGGARFSIDTEEAQRQYDEVVARYTNEDGTKKRGWMKAPNGKPTRLTERQWVLVRTPAFKAWFGDWEKAYYTKGWRNLRNVEDILALPLTDISAYAPLQDKEAVKSAFQSFGLVRNATDGMEVRFPAKAAGRFVFVRRYASAFKELFKTSLRAWSEDETRFEGHKEHRNIEDYHHYVNRFKTPDGEYFVRFTVRSGRESAAEGKHLIHAANVSAVEIYKNEAAQTEYLDRSATSLDDGKKPNIDRKIAYFLSGVNPGNENSSKVVDENGEPLVVYRGSEHDPLAQEPDDGVIKPEAYFTADPKYAGRYGKVRAYYLNIRNPFDVRRPECLADLKKIYPDHEFQRGKSGALDWAEAATVDGEFLRDNFGDKYDGVIYDEGGDPGESGVSYRGISYVPLDGGVQVKSATDNTGAFSENPDIRFSIASLLDEERQRLEADGGARFLIDTEEAQRQYDAVVARYTNADGTKKRGWMKAPNGKPTRLTERQWVLVRTPAFKAWFGDWESDAELAPSDMAGAKSSFRALMSQNAEIRTADGATLRFVSQSAKAYSKEAEHESSSKAAHWVALANIEGLVARSRFMFEEKPRNGSPDIEAYVKYGTVFTFGGEKYLAKITSKRYAGRDAQNFYSVESVSVEKIDARGIHEAIAKGQPLDASDVDRISNILSAGNGENAISSKVVDENGEPLVVAHSTDASFTIFRDMQKTDAGWLGAGFYFFGDRSLDGQYGDNVMECFLNVRNPYYLSPSEHVELAGADSAAHSREFSENLRADGYDGVYFNGDGNSEYAVFSPSQIKSATDNTGAFSANPDIRYSLAPNPNLKADIAAALRKNTGGDDTTVQMKRHDEIVFSDNLPFFEFLGLPNVKVVTDVVKIRKFNIKHHLSEDQIAELPYRYNAPVAVMRDGTDGYVLLTELMAKDDHDNDKPVMVYLRRKGRPSGEVIFIATAFAKNAEDEAEYYGPLMKSGLLFADENKIAGLALGEETESILRTQASGDHVLTSSDYSWWSTRISIAQSSADRNGLSTPAQLLAAVAKGSAKRKEEQQKSQGEGRYSTAAPRSALVYPQLRGMSDDELLSAAIAARIALGKSDKVSDRSVKVTTVQKLMRRLHPDWDTTKIGVESQRVMSGAQKFARRIREDIDRGVSDSLVLEHLPSTMREQFGSEMRQEAREGARMGAFGVRANAALEERQARLVEDAVRVQTGLDAGAIENAFGINLSETIMHLDDNPLTEKEKPQGATGTGEGESEDGQAELGQEEAPSEIDAKVKAVVDDIVSAAGQQAGSDEQNRKNRKAAAGRDAENEAAMGDGEENGDEGSVPADTSAGGDGDALAAAVAKEALNLENPRHLARFVAELARRQWIQEHHLAKDAEVWRDLVAVQFLRRTAQSVYAKLCRDLVYSRSRETAMGRIAKLDNVPTVAGLLSEMEFVGALINAQRIRDTQKQLCEKLDLFLRQNFGAQGHFKPDKEEGKRKVSAEAELRARYMRHAMWLTPDAAAEEARQLQETLDSLSVDFKDAGRDRDQSREFVETIRKLNVLREFGALRHKPVGEIEAAMQWWQDFARGESDDIVREMSDRDIRTKKAAHLLAVAFADPKRTTIREGGKADALNRFITGHMGFISLLQDCMRHASDADAAAVKDIIDYISREVQKSGDRSEAEKRRHNDAFHSAVEGIYGRKFNAVMKDMMAPDERFTKFMGVVGGKRVTPTKGRALQLLVSLLQEGRKVQVEDEDNPGQMKTVWEGGYHDNIVKHHREGQAAEIMRLLDPADLNMLKWLGQWYENNRSDLSGVCHSLFGIGVYAELPNYFPVKMQLETQGLEKGNGVGWTIFPKALTPRVRNERDFDTSADIFSMWASRMEEAAQWKHHAQLGLELRGIFGRSELREAVRANHGASVDDLMQGFITDILAGHGAYDRSTAGVQYFSDQIRGWTALCALGGNIGVMAKQTTSIPAFGFEIGLVNTAKYMVSAFTPEGMAAMRRIWDSEQRKTRWQVGSSEAVRNALNQQGAGALKRMFQASMITNKLGDAVPALVVGQGIYRDCLARGMSEEDAMAETWSLVERTQQSGRMENQTSIQRRNKVGRIMFQFLSTQQQYLQYEVRAIREVIARPDSVKRWGNLGRAILLNHFILTSAYYWMGQLYKYALGQEPPEDELKDWIITCLLGPYGSLFVAGFCCKYTLERAIKGYSIKGGSTMLPMESWLKNQINDGAKLLEAIFDSDGDTWDNMLDAAGRWMSDSNSTVRDLRKIYRYRVKGEPQK